MLIVFTYTDTVTDTFLVRRPTFDAAGPARGGVPEGFTPSGSAGLARGGVPERFTPSGSAGPVWGGVPERFLPSETADPVKDGTLEKQGWIK